VGGPGGAPPDATETLVHKVKYVPAADVAVALEKAYVRPGGTFRVVAEPVSNSVLLSGDPVTIAAARKTINELDTAGADAGQPAERPIHVFTLKHARASETATVLQNVFRTIAVTPDERTNSLIIRAEPNTLVEVQALLDKLDIPVPPKN
jgi:general secretion pathway protein D